MGRVVLVPFVRIFIDNFSPLRSLCEPAVPGAAATRWTVTSRAAATRSACWQFLTRWPTS
jgi:hypothetical protein